MGEITGAGRHTRPRSGDRSARVAAAIPIVAGRLQR